MLLQTLMTLAILVLLAAGLLTSTLVSAKAALHRTVTREIGVSLARGTDDLERWVSRYVYVNHANATWPSTVQTGNPLPVCAAGTSPACSLTETTSFQVTGSTAMPLAQRAAATTLATAQNLQTAVNEQRIAAEVTATITDASGATLGSGTRELTLRIFDAPPWAIVTGSRDLDTVLGATNASEGDTAGVAAVLPGTGTIEASPNPANPASYKNTVIYIKMTCNNSRLNSDQSDPSLDNTAPGNEGLPWGVSSRAFETPCEPAYELSSAHAAPADAYPSADGTYDVGAFSSPTPWVNGSSKSLWPQ